MTTRRGLLTGLGAFFVAAPAIVRATSLMPVKSLGGLEEVLTLTRLDILGNHLYIRPEWQLESNPFTLDDYSKHILAPMINKFKSRIAQSIMNNTSAPHASLLP